MEQLLCHVFADYVIQSDWMALNKSKRSWPCLVHVLLYTSVFLLLTTSWKALAVIGVTHFLLDRFPVIVQRLIWFKNHFGPGGKYVPFEHCKVTGYYDHFSSPSNIDMNGYSQRLSYITIWLYIITDNFLHLTINYLAIKYLG